MNSQAYNTPIDLFIEDYLFKNFKELRPIQLLSLYKLLQEGVTATTDKQITSTAPVKVLSQSKIYNLINTIHFKDLFGLDRINDFKPTKQELLTAQELYKEFLEYRPDRNPGEEYELVQHWAEDIEINDFFTLKAETQGKAEKTPEEILDRIENDPYGLTENDDYQEEKMQIFLRTHAGQDINTAVAMYMVDALRFFSNTPKQEVKDIAFEIAQIGMTGIDPQKDGYRVSKIPNKKFSGYHLLAYYYVSWAIAIPEMLNQLQMPFDKEYDLAQKFMNNG